MTKKIIHPALFSLFLFFAVVIFILAFASNASAQTCGGVEVGDETGVCRSSCSPDEHQVSGSCMGQVCCAQGGTGGGNNNSCNVSCTENGAYYSSQCDPNDWGWGACPNVPGKEMCCVPNTQGSGSSSSTTYAAGGASSGGGWNPTRYAFLGLPAGSIYFIIYNFLFWILAIFGMIALIGFVISGIMYLTSAGSETQIENAKKAMKWSLVGVVVGLIGLVILFAVTELLSGWSTRF